VYNYTIEKTLKEVIMEKTKVTWTLGYTLNTGNFQSLRLDASVEDFVRDGETTKDASDRVYAFVEQELVNKLAEAKEELGG
jgi:hypothetical protein